MKKLFNWVQPVLADANGEMVQQVIGLIARNPADTDSLKPDMQKHGALVLVVRDQ